MPTQFPSANRREDGFGVVEIVIAALLLTVVVSAVAMAMLGGTKLQTRTGTVERLDEVARLSFQHLRGDSSWMRNCTTIGTWCDVRAQIDADLLEDDGLGGACSGGTYRHELTEARVMPVDSAGDGQGSSDGDGATIDYFRVRIVVSVPACARTRLGALSSTFESALDRRGDIPRGSLTVEVCAAVNQVDERMSISGCLPGAGSAFKKQACPPPFAGWTGSPAARCGTAWSWTRDRAASRTSPTPFVMLDRAPATFRIVDTSGATVARSTDANVRRPSVGLYEFPELPAGTYRLVSVVPGGAATGMRLWDTKLIPASTTGGTGANVFVQPDVRSRALLAFRPNDVGRLSLKFDRIVKHHEVFSQTTPYLLAEEFIQTEDWNGNPAQLQAALASVMTEMVSEIVACVTAGTVCIPEFVFLDGVGTSGSGERPKKNCIRFGFRLIVPGESTVNRVYNTCTRYDLFVRFTYDTTRRLADETRQGPPMGATYSTMSMPTFRTLVPAATPGAACPTSGGTIAFGGRKPEIEQVCVNGTRGNVFTRVTLGPFATGLHAGITRFSGPITASWGSPFVNDGGGAWTPARNEAVTPIPGGLKTAIWVHRDGTIETPDGARYAPGTQINVTGRGECYWRYEGGSLTMGSCNPCEPYVQPLSGTYGSCYILRRVEWRRKVYYTGGWADQGLISGTWWENGSTDVVMVCTGVPLPGDHVRTAANCTDAPPQPVSGGGGGGSDGEIPTADVPTSYGDTTLPATAIGPG